MKLFQDLLSLPPLPRKMSEKFRQRSKTAMWQAVGGLLVVLMGLLIYWVSLLQSHHQQRQMIATQNQENTTQAAHILAAQLNILIRSLDLQSQQIGTLFQASQVDSWATRPPAALQFHVQQMLSMYPNGSVTQVSIADLSGNMIFSSKSAHGTPEMRSNIRDREHFQIHRDESIRGLFVSTPVFDRLSQRWSVQLSRAIRDEGKLLGVVVISMSPHYLSELLRTASTHPGSIVLLLNAQGKHLASSRPDFLRPGEGRDIPKNSPFLQQSSTSTRGHYEAVTTIDGVERYHSWQRLAEYPLFVNVGISKAQSQAASEDFIQQGLIYAALNTFLILFASIWIARQFVVGNRNIQLLRDSEERIQKLMSEVPGMVFQYRVLPSGQSFFPFVTAGLTRIFDLPENSLNDSVAPLWGRLHPEDLDEVVHSLTEAGKHLTVWRSRHRLLMPDGSERWVQAHAKPELKSDGSILYHGYVHDITEEYAVQQALRKSEEGLRRTIAAVQDGLWEWDIARGNLTWDARCHEMLGYESDIFNIRYQHWINMIHPDDRAKIEALFQCDDTQQRYVWEFRMRTIQGEWLWVEARGRVMSWEKGQPSYMVGTFSDISKRIEQTHIYQALLEKSAAAIFVASPTREILEANASAREIFLPPDFVPGYSFRNIHIDDVNFFNFLPHYEQLKRDKLIRFEFPLIDRAREVRWFDIQGTLLDPEDVDGSVIWTMFDITERMHAQNQLLLTQQRLNAVLNQFPGGVLVEDERHQNIVVINQALCNILRLKIPAEQLIGRPHAELIKALPADTLLRPLLEMSIQADEILSTIGNEFSAADGRVFELEHVALHNNDMPLGTFWLIRDITLRKVKENRLQHLASTDALTDLPNRRTFMNSLEEELEALHSHKDRLSALMMLDLDHFKKVNDTYGHAVGDQVLRHLSKILKTQARDHDQVGRLGGEEFAILFTNLDETNALRRATDLVQFIAYSSLTTDAGEISFTASIGLVFLHTHESADVLNANELLARADAALYQAKEQGRNRVVRWNEQSQDFEFVASGYSED